MAAQYRAKLGHGGQLMLPAPIRQALRIVEGDEIEFTVTDYGKVVLHTMTDDATEKRWFCKPEWRVEKDENTKQPALPDPSCLDTDEDLFRYLEDLERLKEQAQSATSPAAEAPQH
ncbi:AbrB/MazE/SpoVT family DNA-binding domain-containing protein [Goodfellowiella coeruleoviolacea]|uniref:Looped-hinge helix DNA binding domain-containing protein, AbrB family n=1 Tax=Goodfellowiella coeruleoviolacea TaxID=334858 RepID=A0AAE3GEF8_9PSEU|nr:AbrB/MazE/SpoVT family DNA-binding domain-containing protein [Goodfellowiella coeruleoviolacea]MCP2165834.1 looped-hinge helix DNA binding domain-containing protein, AbrB family [Goodfellowiella coeruleoviolacea]